MFERPKTSDSNTSHQPGIESDVKLIMRILEEWRNYHGKHERKIEAMWGIYSFIACMPAEDARETLRRVKIECERAHLDKTLPFCTIMDVSVRQMRSDVKSYYYDRQRTRTFLAATKKQYYDHCRVKPDKQFKPEASWKLQQPQRRLGR